MKSRRRPSPRFWETTVVEQHASLNDGCRRPLSTSATETSVILPALVERSHPSGFRSPLHSLSKLEPALRMMRRALVTSRSRSYHASSREALKCLRSLKRIVTHELSLSEDLQALLHLIGESVSSIPPNAIQSRNAHSYIDDFEQET